MLKPRMLKETNHGWHSCRNDSEQCPGPKDSNTGPATLAFQPAMLCCWALDVGSTATGRASTAGWSHMCSYSPIWFEMAELRQDPHQEPERCSPDFRWRLSKMIITHLNIAESGAIRPWFSLMTQALGHLTARGLARQRCEVKLLGLGGAMSRCWRPHHFESLSLW